MTEQEKRDLDEYMAGIMGWEVRTATPTLMRVDVKEYDDYYIDMKRFTESYDMMAKI